MLNRIQREFMSENWIRLPRLALVRIQLGEIQPLRESEKYLILFLIWKQPTSQELTDIPYLFDLIG